MGESFRLMRSFHIKMAPTVSLEFVQENCNLSVVVAILGQ